MNDSSGEIDQAKLLQLLEYQEFLQQYRQISIKSQVQKYEADQIIKILEVAQKNEELSRLLLKADRQLYTKYSLNSASTEELDRQALQILEIIEQDHYSELLLEEQSSSAYNDKFCDDRMEKLISNQALYSDLHKVQFIDQIIDLYSPGNECSSLVREYYYISVCETISEAQADRVEDILVQSQSDLTLHFFISEIDRWILQSANLLSELKYKEYETQKLQISETIQNSQGYFDKNLAYRAILIALAQHMKQKPDYREPEWLEPNSDQTSQLLSTVSISSEQELGSCHKTKKRSGLYSFLRYRCNLQHFFGYESLSKSISHFSNSKTIVAALLATLTGACGSLLFFEFDPLTKRYDSNSSTSRQEATSFSIPGTGFWLTTSYHDRSNNQVAFKLDAIISQKLPRLPSRLNVDYRTQLYQSISTLESRQALAEKRQRTSEWNQQLAEVKQLEAESYQHLAEARQSTASQKRAIVETQRQQAESLRWLNEARKWERLAEKWSRQSEIERSQAQKYLLDSQQHLSSVQQLDSMAVYVRTQEDPISVNSPDLYSPNR
jgi:hypothetical protein